MIPGGKIKTCCALLVLSALTPGLATEAHGQTVAFTDVHVVVAESDETLENQTVLVRDGVIEAIGPSSAVEVPAGTTLIEGSGMYLIPGLADMHVHINSRDEYINYLAHGVTTVMSMGAPESRSRRIRDDRDAIRARELIGPTIITTGRILDGDPPTGGGNTLWSLASPEAARAAVTEQAEAGFDFIKIYNNVSRESFDAIVEEAHRRGLPVAGHIPRTVDPMHSLGAGLDLVAHAEEFFFTVFKGPRSTRDIDKTYRPDESLIPGIVTLLEESGVWVIPNLSFSFSIQMMWDDLDNIWSDPEMAYLSPALESEWRRGNLSRRDHVANFIWRDNVKHELMQELTVTFQAAGIPLLLGTDAPLEALFPGKSAHRELRELVKAGLSNAEALAVATSNAGDYAAARLNRDEQFGRVSVGYAADLVLLEANPLEDIRNAQRIAGVMVRGRWLDRAEIEERRSALSERYSSIRRTRVALSDAAEGGNLGEVASTLVSDHRESAELMREIERSINSIGYRLVGENRLDDALEVFTTNTELFPSSANVWDSLAETYLAVGDRAAAIRLYRKALEVDPSFGNARTQLDRILAGG